MNDTTRTARRRLLTLAVLIAAALTLWATWVNTGTRWQAVCAGGAANPAETLTVAPFCLPEPGATP